MTQPRRPRQTPITFYPDPPTSDTTRVRDALDRLRAHMNASSRSEALRRIIISADKDTGSKRSQSRVFRALPKDS